MTVRRAQKASKRAEKAAAEGRAGSVWGPSASASGPVPVGGAGFVKPGQPGSVLPMEGMMGTMGSMAMGNGAAGGPTPGKRYSVSAGSVGSAASPVFDTSGSGTMSPVDVRFEALTPSSDASFGDGVMVVGSGGLVSFADGQVSPVSWGAQQMQMMQEQQEQDQQKQQLEMVLRQPDQPVEVVAECHFLSNFVLMPRQGTTRGFMDYIVPLLNGPGTTSHLRMALRACGLASLNNREKSVQNLVMRSALLEYAKALQETRKIIADKTEALSDATLATTLLLGMFEVSCP